VDFGSLDEETRRRLRRATRRDVRIAADVEIILRSGKRFSKGTAIIRNVSLRGALIGKLVLRKRVLPAEWFRIRVEFRSRDYRGVGALCKPVRFGGGSEFEIAVEFDDLWAGSRGTRRKKK
jgi:hypothetical protein